MDIMKRDVFITYKTKASIYGTINLATTAIHVEGKVDPLWVDTLLDDPDLTSIQFRD